MDEDANDAWWAEAQLQEQARWQHFYRVHNEFVEWTKQEYPEFFQHRSKSNGISQRHDPE